jgi:gas vesicle protein
MLKLPHPTFMTRSCKKMTLTKWKIIAFGIGALAGAAATSFFTKRPTFVRDTATTALSYGITAKRKIETLAELAKENITDLVAESDQKAQDRQVKNEGSGS